MAATRVALATQRDLPDWERDDLPFQDALAARGIGYDCVAWDDPDIAWSAYDAILLRTTWDYMEKADAFREWIGYAAIQTRLFNPVEILRWNLQKTYLRALAAEGVPLAPTLWVAGGEAVALEDWLGTHEATRGFIKPVVGCCAWETLRFDCDAAGFKAAHGHLERAAAAGGMMVQPYLPRVETDGEVSAIFFDGAFSHAVQKVPVPGDYRVQDDFGASDHPYAMSADARAIAKRAVDTAEALVGERLLYARVDMMWDRADALVLTELELIEPSLFFRHDSRAPGRLADALARWLKAGR